MSQLDNLLVWGPSSIVNILLIRSLKDRNNASISYPNSMNGLGVLACVLTDHIVRSALYL